MVNRRCHADLGRTMEYHQVFRTKFRADGVPDRRGAMIDVTGILRLIGGGELLIQLRQNSNVGDLRHRPNQRRQNRPPSPSTPPFLCAPSLPGMQQKIVTPNADLNGPSVLFGLVTVQTDRPQQARQPRSSPTRASRPRPHSGNRPNCSSTPTRSPFNACPHRQQILLPLTPPARHPRRSRYHPQTHAPTPPQTNGKVERFDRTPLDESAYARPYQSETERRAALPQWLHTYNHHRGHTALAGKPPASRVPNLITVERPRGGLRKPIPNTTAAGLLRDRLHGPSGRSLNVCSAVTWRRLGPRALG